MTNNEGNGPSSGKWEDVPSTVHRGHRAGKSLCVKQRIGKQ